MVTMITFVVEAPGTVAKGNWKSRKIGGRIETIPTTVLLRSARILRLAVSQTPVKDHQQTLE